MGERRLCTEKLNAVCHLRLWICDSCWRYLGDVHELRVQLRDGVFHRGVMGVLSDQGLLDLDLDPHQLETGTRNRVRGSIREAQ